MRRCVHVCMRVNVCIGIFWGTSLVVLGDAGASGTHLACTISHRRTYDACTRCTRFGNGRCAGHCDASVRSDQLLHAGFFHKRDCDVQYHRAHNRGTAGRDESVSGSTLAYTAAPLNPGPISSGSVISLGQLRLTGTGNLTVPTPTIGFTVLVRQTAPTHRVLELLPGLFQVTWPPMVRMVTSAR